MDRKLTHDHFPPKTQKILEGFFDSYQKITKQDVEILKTFRKLLGKQLKNPFQFEPYHKKVRSPFDYYQFGLDFVRPLIDLSHSRVTGLENLKKIDDQLHKQENVILLANHQTETDPLAISILLENSHPHIGEKIIYVAGERVVTDPLAIPFSMGCDLLCIYSKRYIHHPPEEKMQKQLHNKHTMELMSRLFKEGGKIIYVAPSGGRDRRGPSGAVEIAPFDPASVEMMLLMAKKSGVITHFYPLTLATYDLLPPPETVQKELGEARKAKRCPIYMDFREEFDMECFFGSDEKNKVLKRKMRAEAIWKIVKETYERIK